MNLARAKRRWQAWDRYEARAIELCGEHHISPPGAVKASYELASWRRTGLALRFGHRQGDWRR